MTVEADAVVIVACDGRDAALTDETDRFVRLGAVADEIAEVIDRIRRLSGDRREDRFSGGTVAVQVGEDGDPGRHPALLPLVTVAGAGTNAGAHAPQGKEGNERGDVAPVLA